MESTTNVPRRPGGVKPGPGIDRPRAGWQTVGGMFHRAESSGRAARRGAAGGPADERPAGHRRRWSGFIRARLDSRGPFGLEFTAAVVIALVFLAVFLGVVEDLLGREALTRADLRVVNLFQIFRTPGVTRVMAAVSNAGGGTILGFGAVLAILILLLRGRRPEALALAVASGGGELILAVLKNAFHRSRPPLVNSLVTTHSYSFPSGHSFASAAIFLTAAYLVVRASKRPTALKVVAVVAAVIGAAVVGFSRVYLGAHFPSDVLAGWSLGVTAASAGAAAFAAAVRSHRRLARTAGLRGRTAAVWTAGALVVWAAVAVVFDVKHPIRERPRVPVSPEVLPRSAIPGRVFARLPRTTETITGEPVEPINLVFVGTPRALAGGLEHAGWSREQPLSFRGLALVARSILARRLLPGTPGPPAFWNSVPNAMEFERRQDGSSDRREHLRVWRTPFREAGDGVVWVASAHFDRGVRFRSLLPELDLDPYIDIERDRVERELRAAGVVESVETFRIVGERSGRNASGQPFVTDGLALLIVLR